MSDAVGDGSAARAQVAAATRRLEEAGVPSARHDAEALAAHLLGVARTELLLTDGPLDASVYDELVTRRASREPLQHIVGTTAFRRIELAVGPGVFVPRPETEVVVEAALMAIRGLDAPVVVDLCAGSGAIALSIAVEHPGASVHAVELSPDALVWLRRNVATCAPAVVVTAADIAAPDLLEGLAGTVDVVVSNPPYVPDDAAAGLEPEVRDHDPALALFAGVDGLDSVRTVAATAHRLLRPGGTVIVEHSNWQAAGAVEVMRRQGFAEVEDHRDLTGRDRYVIGTRAGSKP